MSLSSFREKGLLQGDMVLWMIFICLCMISVVEVYSASSSMTYKSGSYWVPVMEHAGYVIAGMILAWMMHLLPCKIYDQFRFHPFLLLDIADCGALFRQRERRLPMDQHLRQDHPALRALQAGSGDDCCRRALHFPR